MCENGEQNESDEGEIGENVAVREYCGGAVCMSWSLTTLLEVIGNVCRFRLLFFKICHSVKRR